MAMQVGDGAQKADINVTPMIDVLLVLLIIFMVMGPLTNVGLDTQVAQESDPNALAIPDPTQLVVTVHEDGSADFNQEFVSAEAVAGKFHDIYRLRGNRPVFLRADPDLTFAPVAHVMDAARGAEITRIALMPRQ